MNKIYFFVNCHTQPRETSGGDVRFREIAKRINNIEKIIITSKFGYDICKKEKIKAKYFLTSKEKTGKNIILSYLQRMLKSISLDLNISKNDVLYSTSDMLPDVFPPFCLKLKNKDVKWVSLLHLIAPNPCYGPKQYYLKQKKLKIPSINSIYFKLNQILSIYLMKFMADRILVVNSEIRNYLIRKGVRRERIIIISNGVDIDYIEKAKLIQKEKYDACFVGRFHPQKGILDLVKIWQNVCGIKTNAKLAIIGHGQKKISERLLQDINKLDLVKNIDIFGFLPEEEKYSILKSSKLFICPSYYESWGIVNAEAMACKLPVVAYNLPIYEEIYEKNILTVPISDIKIFAETVIKLLNDETYQKKRGFDAERYIHKYRWDNIVETELSIMEGLK